MSTPGAPDPYAAPEPGTPAGEPTGAGAPAAPSGPPSYPSAPSGPPAYPSGPPAYPGAAAGYPAAAPAGYGGGTEANNLAVWSLVLAILGWVCTGLLTSIPAIIVGHRAKRAAAEGRANNPGMATAGVVLGWIATVLNAISLAIFLVIVATRGWDGFVELVQQYSTWPTG
jgi:hypothetical protein